MCIQIDRLSEKFLRSIRILYYPRSYRRRRISNTNSSIYNFVLCSIRYIQWWHDVEKNTRVDNIILDRNFSTSVVVKMIIQRGGTMVHPFVVVSILGPFKLTARRMNYFFFYSQRETFILCKSKCKKRIKKYTLFPYSYE